LTLGKRERKEEKKLLKFAVGKERESEKKNFEIKEEKH
jgi:hypothetical protein